jgi:ATP-dependent RNA helicase DDX1
MPSSCFQNAEMLFNFGAQPFKHQPKNGYSAICQAPPNQTSNSETKSGNYSCGGDKQSRINNAPQAIIIEVIRVF